MSWSHVLIPCWCDSYTSMALGELLRSFSNGFKSVLAYWQCSPPTTVIDSLHNIKCSGYIGYDDNVLLWQNKLCVENINFPVGLCKHTTEDLLLHTRQQLNTPATTITQDPLQIFKPARRDRGCRSGESDFPAAASEIVVPLSMSQGFGLFGLAAGARTTLCLRVYHCYLCCFLFFYLVNHHFMLWEMNLLLRKEFTICFLVKKVYSNY